MPCRMSYKSTQTQATCYCKPLSLASTRVQPLHHMLSIDAHVVQLTSTGVANTRMCWMADRNTLGLGLANPTQQMACSSPEYSTGTSPLQGHSTLQQTQHELEVPVTATRLVNPKGCQQPDAVPGMWWIHTTNPLRRQQNMDLDVLLWLAAPVLLWLAAPVQLLLEGNRAPAEVLWCHTPAVVAP